DRGPGARAVDTGSGRIERLAPKCGALPDEEPRGVQRWEEEDQKIRGEARERDEREGSHRPTRWSDGNVTRWHHHDSIARSDGKASGSATAVSVSTGSNVWRRKRLHVSLTRPATWDGSATA